MDAYLVPITPEDTAQAKRLLEKFPVSRLASPSSEEVKSHTFNEAIHAAQLATLETRMYLKHRREGGNRDAETEQHLTVLWMDAGSKILPYDPELANLCYVKGHAWADETTWNAPENRGLPVTVDQMLQRVRRLAENPPPKDVPKWFPISGVIFTLSTVVSLFYLLLGPQDISSGRRVIFDVWVAFCLAASVSFLGGTANAEGKLPWLGNSPIQFATVGGVAVFIVAFVILYSVYH